MNKILLRFDIQMTFFKYSVPLNKDHKRKWKERKKEREGERDSERERE